MSLTGNSPGLLRAHNFAALTHGVDFFALGLRSASMAALKVVDIAAKVEVPASSSSVVRSISRNSAWTALR